MGRTQVMFSMMFMSAWDFHNITNLFVRSTACNCTSWEFTLKSDSFAGVFLNQTGSSTLSHWYMHNSGKPKEKHQMNKYPALNWRHDDKNYPKTQKILSLDIHTSQIIKIIKCSVFFIHDKFTSFLILTLSLSETPSVKLMVNSSTLGTFSLFFSVWYSVRVFTTTWRREKMLNTLRQ